VSANVTFLVANWTGLLFLEWTSDSTRWLQTLTSALPHSHNCSGCWSSPLTAQRADDSYEEGIFLVGVFVPFPSIQEVSNLQLRKPFAQGSCAMSKV
jgi:hypothetical protein